MLNCFRRPWNRRWFPLKAFTAPWLKCFMKYHVMEIGNLPCSSREKKIRMQLIEISNKGGSKIRSVHAEVCRFDGENTINGFPNSSAWWFTRQCNGGMDTSRICKARLYAEALEFSTTDQQTLSPNLTVILSIFLKTGLNIETDKIWHSLRGRIICLNYAFWCKSKKKFIKKWQDLQICNEHCQRYENDNSWSVAKLGINWSLLNSFLIRRVK